MSTVLGGSPAYAGPLKFSHAIVRDMSSSFEASLKLAPPPEPIDLDLAKKQHEAYMGQLERLVPKLVRIEGDPAHPDCNFIEDTAILVGDMAVISRMGAVERRGEEIPVLEALRGVGVKNISRISAPATMDGGDILFTGNHLIVGLSRRTNEAALEQLQVLFKGKVPVVGVPVTEGLHLKSIISLFDSETLVLADTAAGRALQVAIQAQAPGYEFVLVPDAVASNVLRIESTLIIQKGFPRSELVLQSLCDKKDVKLVTLDMSELIKADGALTCGSLLFNIE